ncbi:Uncharacterised protein [Burkholderia pseudomallei]|nr:Uncharacterised protein [Burkholderia pseudomallei]
MPLWFDTLPPVSVVLPPLVRLPWSLITVAAALAVTAPCALVVAFERFTSPPVAFSDRLPFAAVVLPATFTPAPVTETLPPATFLPAAFNWPVVVT